MRAAVLGGPEFCSGKGWVAQPSPSPSIPVWNFLWHLPLLEGVSKPQPDLFCLGWFDNPRVMGMIGKDLGLPVSFPSLQGVSQSLPPLAPFSARRAGEELLEELPAERFVSQVLVS